MKKNKESERIMIYFMLFIEGILTFISPCILPLIPIYLTYFGSMKSQDDSKSTVKEAALFVLGFSIVFIAFSLFLNTIGHFLLIHRTTINIIAGSLLILFGIDVLFENRVTHRLFGGANIQNADKINSFVLGLIFAVSWSPCVGIYLASALAVSMTSSHYLESVMMLVMYSLGLGIPFILSAMLIEESKQLFNQLKKYMRQIQIVSAILLILFGISVATGYIYYLIPV